MILFQGEGGGGGGGVDYGLLESSGSCSFSYRFFKSVCLVLGLLVLILWFCCAVSFWRSILLFPMVLIALLLGVLMLILMYKSVLFIQIKQSLLSSELSELQELQRGEYREWVSKVHEDAIRADSGRECPDSSTKGWHGFGRMMEQFQITWPFPGIPTVCERLQWPYILLRFCICMCLCFIVFPFPDLMKDYFSFLTDPSSALGTFTLGMWVLILSMAKSNEILY